MYSVSSELAAALESQRLHLRVTCGETVLDSEDILGLTYNSAFGDQEEITIGSITSAMVKLTVSGQREWLDEIITVEVGAEVSGTVEYIPLGTFSVTECNKSTYDTELTAYDAVFYSMDGIYMPTFGSSTEAPTVAEVLADIANQCGLVLDALPSAASSEKLYPSWRTVNMTVDKWMTGYTYREMASCAAAYVGGNCFVNRDGKLAVRTLTRYDVAIKSDDCYSEKRTLERSRAIRFLTTTTCTTRGYTGESFEYTYTYHRPYTTWNSAYQVFVRTFYGLKSSTESVIWDNFGTSSFYTGRMEIIGGLLFEPGDIFYLDRVGTLSTGRFAIQTLELKIDGGCQATIASSAHLGTYPAGLDHFKDDGARPNTVSSVDDRFKELRDQIEMLRQAIQS